MNEQYCSKTCPEQFSIKYIRRALGGFLVAGIFLGAGVVRAASTVPFTDNFDYPEGTTLHGSNGWSVAGSGSAIASAGRAAISDAAISNGFSDAQETVSITFDLQPRFSEDAPTVPADATFAFYVWTNGLITAYDGATPSNLSHTALSESTANNIRIDVNYAATNWSLYVDGDLAAASFAFYSTSGSSFTELGFMETSTATSYVDSVQIDVLPSVSFEMVSDSYEESAGAVTGTVSLSSAYVGTSTVQVVVSGGTAFGGGVDYTYTPTTLSFDPGETNKTFTFDIVEDTLLEPAETIVFALAGYTNCVAGATMNFTATILVDATDEPALDFALASDFYAENSGTVTGSVNLSAAYTATATVQVAVSGGTASGGGVDYTYAPATLSFDPGETNKTFTFDIVDDTTTEVAETIVFALTGPVNAVLGTVTNFTATIEVDESDWSLPFFETFETLTLGDLNGQRGWQGTDAVVQDEAVNNGFQGGGITSQTGVARHTFSDAQTNVWTELYIQPVFGDTAATPPAGSSFAFFVDSTGQVVAYDGTETTQLVHTALAPDAWVRFLAHSDYAATNWSLYVNDALVADGLGFYDPTAVSYAEFGLIGGAGASNAPVDDVSITLTTPDTLPPSVSFEMVSDSYEESAGAVTGTVSLSSAYVGTSTVQVVVSGGTAFGGGVDYTYTPTTLSFDPGETNKTFTFDIVEDTLLEPAETIVFALAGYTNCVAGATTNFTATILVDATDEPALDFALASDSYAENSGTVTGSVNLSAAYTATATVQVAVSGGTASGGGVDYTYAPATLSFDPGETNKTFTFDIVDDTTTEVAETIVFALTGPVNAVLGTVTNFTATIEVDESDWSLPFFETFETLTLGDLNGQRGWQGTDAVVQDEAVNNGFQGGGITSQTGVARHTFSDAQTNVWTELYIQPVFGDTAATPPAGSSFAFFVDSTGQVVAYDGTETTQLVHTALAPDAWVRFLAHSDYAATNWSLYVNDALVADGLGFYDPTAVSYAEFGLIGGAGASNAPVDDVSITLTMPAELARGSLFMFR